MATSRPSKRQRVSPTPAPTNHTRRTTSTALTERHNSAISEIDQAMQHVEQVASQVRNGTKKTSAPTDDLYRRRSVRELTRPRQILRDLSVNTKLLRSNSNDSTTKPNDRPARSPTASPTALADQQYQHNLSLKPDITDGLRRRLSQSADKTPVHQLERYTDPQLGECVRTRSNIPINSFVVEYGGELLTAKEARRREELYSEQQSTSHDPGCYLFYFNRASRHYCIDGTEPRPEYGLARYINHSVMKCNLYARSVLDVNKQVHLVFFAARDIQKGETLWIDYGDRQNVDAFPWLLG